MYAYVHEDIAREISRQNIEARIEIARNAKMARAVANTRTRRTRGLNDRVRAAVAAMIRPGGQPDVASEASH